MTGFPRSAFFRGEETATTRTALVRLQFVEICDQLWTWSCGVSGLQITCNVARAYILSDADVSWTSIAGPGPLLPAIGGATKGGLGFVGVCPFGVGMIPAFLSDAIRSDPTAISDLGLDDTAANTEDGRSWAREACVTGGVGDPC